MTPGLDAARAIGDAVLYEGYLLYPYRASSAKNAVRWQFGVLMPPGYADPERGEYKWSRTECLAEPEAGATLHIRVRFLHLQQRAIYDGDRAVRSLTVDGTEYLAWDEAVERELDVTARFDESTWMTLLVPGSESVEPLAGNAKLVRTTWPLTADLRVRADPLDGPFGGVRLRVDLGNTTRWHEDQPTRPVALRRAMLAAHLVLGIDAGHFLSLADPPQWAGVAAAECRNERTWPVLIDDTVVLSSPIILNDRPEIAPESQGPLFDGTEIDEILTLRTMTMTDEEKRQARATDPRAAEILDRVDGMPPELLDRLHGAIRSLGPPDPKPVDPLGPDDFADPETDAVVVDGVAVAAGHRVLLNPAHHGADAQDMFLTGRSATVRAVLSDVDGRRYVAVTLDDDPAADLQHEHGRYRYFTPDEIAPYNGVLP